MATGINPTCVGVELFRNCTQYQSFKLNRCVHELVLRLHNQFRDDRRMEPCIRATDVITPELESKYWQARDPGLEAQKCR